MTPKRLPFPPRGARAAAFVLILACQLGCTGGAVPVALALKSVIYWVGKKAAESAVFYTVEKLFDRLFSQHAAANELQVDVNPLDPLRGRCPGPLQLQNADDPAKSILLVDFPVVRPAEGSPWQPDPAYVRKIEASLKGR
jgi:hypothetical protein